VSDPLPPRALAALASWGRQPRGAVAGAGGKNSRLYFVQEENGEQFCLKLHHVENGGESQRYEREKAFYAAARASASNWIPRDLYWDDEQRAVILAFVQGETMGAVDEAAVLQAGAFIRDLQTSDTSRAGPASEAVLRPQDHVAIVDRRVALLDAVIDEEARDFIKVELEPTWRKVRQRVSEEKTTVILSPSDFGFHNVIRRAPGSLCFFDFEHAGLDDPAKLVCDFCVRPGSSVGGERADMFGEAAGFDPEVTSRAKRLMNLYRLKWACIALNEFTAQGEQRRRFASADDPGIRHRQLQKARALVAEAKALI